MRLNVYLQKAGAGSRREAERLVADGRVSVNGVTATATTPVEEGDSVLLDGRPVAPETKPLPRLFLLHKPDDVLVTHRDHKNRPTIFDLPALNPPLWTDRHPRVMNVGRLDVNSEGLLVLSSDGPLAQAMMSPEMALSRLYRVRVRGQLRPDEKGITIDGVHYGKIDANMERRTGRNQWVVLTLTEGKNREVRRVLEHLGLEVSRLLRTSYGPFELLDLPRGQAVEVRQVDVERFIKSMADPVLAQRLPPPQYADQQARQRIRRKPEGRAEPERPSSRPARPAAARPQPEGARSEGTQAKRPERKRHDAALRGQLVDAPRRDGPARPAGRRPAPGKPAAPRPTGRKPGPNNPGKGPRK